MQSYYRLDFALWFTKKVTFGQRTLLHKYKLSAILYKPQHRTYLEPAVPTTGKCESRENQSYNGRSVNQASEYQRNVPLPKERSEHLPDVQLAYNSAEHASTGVSPYELVYKEHPRSNFEMLTKKMSPTTMEAKNDRIKGEAAELLRQAVESDLKASCALQLLKAISGASRTGRKPEEESTRFAQGRPSIRK